jgi:hypothetical protein
MTTVIAFCAGLIVGWNFLAQPQWVKDKVNSCVEKVKGYLSK